MIEGNKIELHIWEEVEYKKEFISFLEEQGLLKDFEWETKTSKNIYRSIDHLCDRQRDSPLCWTDYAFGWADTARGGIFWQAVHRAWRAKHRLLHITNAKNKGYGWCYSG